ncbi:MAG: hypothetical protein AB8B83_04795 [Bdellovibrionales bacterium]
MYATQFNDKTESVIVDLPPITQTDGKIHICTDGNFISRLSLRGMSMVVLRNDGTEIAIPHKDKMVPRVDHEHQNKISEIQAVTEALKSLPPLQNIHIHTDFLDTVRFMQGKKTRLMPAEMRVLEPFIKDLKSAISQHSSVTVSYASDENEAIPSELRRLMTIAHNTACKASGGFRIKKVPQASAREEVIEHAKTEMCYVPRAASKDFSTVIRDPVPTIGAMDVIDLGLETLGSFEALESQASDSPFDIIL